MQRILDEKVKVTSVEKVVLEADVIDLSMMDDQQTDFSHAAIYIGQKADLRDDVLGETVASRVIRVIRDMAMVTKVQVELQDPAQVARDEVVAKVKDDIVDVLVDLKDRIDELAMQDTGLEDWDATTLNDLADAIYADVVDAIIADGTGPGTEINDLADAIYADIVDAIIADGTELNDLADALMPDTVDAILADETELAALKAAIDTDTHLGLSSATPAADTASGSAGAGTTASRGTHAHPIPVYT